jgi:uncharacterized protein YjdB
MRRIFVSLFTAAAIAACADQPTATQALLAPTPGDSTLDSTRGHRPPGRVVSINIFPSAESVAVGDSAAFFADARDTAGNQVATAQFRWTVADPTVARIEGDFGSSIILRALRSGSTTVTAQSQGTSGSAFLVVFDSLPPPPPDSGVVATVTVTPPVDSVAVGDSAAFLATPRDSLGDLVTGAVVVWSVSDSTIAQIDGVFGTSILLRALKSGTATVTATSAGKSGSGTLVVQ